VTILLDMYMQQAYAEYITITYHLSYCKSWKW